MSGLIRFFKLSAMFADALHFVFWIIWLLICSSGLLKMHEINPALAGWRLVLFYGLPFVMMGLLAYDVRRLWVADEKHRKLWLSLVIRTVSVLLMLTIAGLLLGPALYQIYYGEFI